MTSYDNCRNGGRTDGARLGLGGGYGGFLMGEQRAAILLEQLPVHLLGRQLLVGEGQLAGALPADRDAERLEPVPQVLEAVVAVGALEDGLGEGRGDAEVEF